MNDPTIWWLLSGAAVAVELLTGTFYLLMIAIGFVAGALAAHAGLSGAWQMLLTALVGLAAVAAWHVLRGPRPKAERASANKDVNMDIGESVTVTAWQADRTASVHYRGAQWAVALAEGANAQVGAQRIVEVLGNRLIVVPQTL